MGPVRNETQKNFFIKFDPIIVNSDGTIIGGHQRYNVLLDLGYDTTQVVVVDATKEVFMKSPYPPHGASA